MSFDFNKDYGKLAYAVEHADCATLYAMLYTHVYNNAINVFEWKGLPKEIKPKYIEYALFNFGACVFGKKKGGQPNLLLKKYNNEIEYIALPPSGTYNYNFNGDPIAWRACGINYNQGYNVLDSVLMENNSIRMPSVQLISEFISRAVDALQAADVNINASKTPIAIYGDEKSLKTLVSQYKQNRRNAPITVWDKTSLGSAGRLEVVDLDVEYKADKFWTMYRNYMNSVYELLGINALTIEKKERLITDEATANDEQQLFNVGAMLKARQEACEKINEMFGLNISVDLRYKEENTIEAVKGIRVGDYSFEGGMK